MNAFKYSKLLMIEEPVTYYVLPQMFNRILNLQNVS
jgi:hypothetical protein